MEVGLCSLYLEASRPGDSRARCRHFWWNGGYFGSIYQVRAMLPKPEVSISCCALRQRVLTIRCAARQSNQARLVNDLIAGTVGGLVGTVINTP